MIWIFIFLVMLLLTVSGFAYLVSRAAKFDFIKDNFGKKTKYAVSTLVIVLLFAVIAIVSGVVNAMIVIVHLMLFWLIFEGIFALASRLGKSELKRYWTGYAAIAFTAIYIAIGVFFAYHVFRTEYTVDIDADMGVESFKIVGFSDSHVGTTFHGDKFADYVRQINNEKPDIVVIAGDFVDDSTSYEDMVKSCKELSKLDAKYGVYYVFGNHDVGYYGKGYRGYGKEELVENLTKNNITVLEDNVVNVAENIYVCGRRDASQADRLTMEQLSQAYDDESCVIVLDHQPNDYKAEAKAGADLVISGHTHGGQLIPITKAGELLGMNDMTYGYKKTDRTNFIVSSGISDWEIKMKTGCKSEYFVINLK